MDDINYPTIKVAARDLKIGDFVIGADGDLLGTLEHPIDAVDLDGLVEIKFVGRAVEHVDPHHMYEIYRKDWSQNDPANDVWHRGE